MARTPDSQPDSWRDDARPTEREHATSPELTVIKIGTSAITDRLGNFDYTVARAITEQVEILLSRGERAIIVSSGAIGLGMKKLGVDSFPASVKVRQQCSLFGLYELMHSWQEVTDRPVSGHLVTHDMFEDPKKLADFHQGIKASLDAGGIPIINENDAISVEEIRRKFGDNDELAADLTVDLEAERLIIFSNVGGLFTKNPEKHVDADLIGEVTFGSEVPAEVDGKSVVGTGGMSTKQGAIKKATGAGSDVYLTSAAYVECISQPEAFQGTVFHRKSPSP